MTAAQSTWFFSLFAPMLAPKGVETVSQWCEREVYFNEPGCTGRFSFSGREYLREPLDNWSDPTITDQITVFGTRSGKTRIHFGGLGWLIATEPSRVLFVKPTTKGTAGAENDARTRFIPMLRASRLLAALIPTKGMTRHDFKTAQQMLAGSIVDWTGSNSVANLASNPARVVIQDEVDKFNTTRKRDSEGNEVEADASALADERCKEFSNPKRFKSGTPTLISGNTWQELLKSDLRRYFVPCPNCGKSVVFAWSKQFTMLEKTGCEAYVAWDPEAKAAGIWDFERVKASAHAVCPHCSGKILDAHKTKMIRAGEWRPTRTGAPGYRGYHLPSMYCSHRECNFGNMAVKFLKQKLSVSGLQGFINSDLAEPYLNQEVSVNRTEIIGAVSVGDGWTKLLTVDCQQKAPYFWYVVRAWSGSQSHGIAAGHCDSWEDIEAIQKQHGIHNCAVMVDSGYGAKDDAEVYRTCAAHSNIIEGQQEQLPSCLGWIPAKGMDTRRRWTDNRQTSPTKGLQLPFRYVSTDPYMGTDKAGYVRIELFEFAADFFKDILANLRLRKGVIKWSVDSAVATEEYWKHMDGQDRKDVVNRMTNKTESKWMKRHRYWPDHILSCEIMQVAFANSLTIFQYQATEEKK